MDPLSHIATAQLAVPAGFAFDFLADPVRLGRWSLGCMDTAPAEGRGVYTGRSLFDGGPVWLHIDADRANWLITYHVGSAAERAPRIVARIVPPEVCGLRDGTCYASLIAWRSAGMDGDRWHRLCTTHATEIELIRAQCERAYTGASG